MSEEHRIVMVQVNAVEEETLRLADIMGHVPTREVVEVLDSQWARQKGWKTSIKGREYRLQLSEKVAMEFLIEENGEVKLKRVAASKVEESQIFSKKKVLESLLKKVKEQYNLAFNEVLGMAIAKTLSNRAKDIGYVVDEKLHEQDHVIDMELKINVCEMA